MLGRTLVYVIHFLYVPQNEFCSIYIVCWTAGENKQPVSTWDALNYAIKTLCMQIFLMYSLNMLFQASPCHVFLHPPLIDIAFVATI